MALKERRGNESARLDNAKGKKSRDEKAYFTEEITDRAESEEEEDSNIILSSDSEKAFTALADNTRNPAIKESIAAEWFLGTGSSSHVAGDKKLFTSLRPLDTSRRIKCGGGYLNVTGIGTAIVEYGWNRLVLENV
jgi:hypothetical protein